MGNILQFSRHLSRPLLPLSIVAFCKLSFFGILFSFTLAHASPLAWPSINSFKTCLPPVHATQNATKYNEDCYQGVVDYFRSHPGEFSYFTSAPARNLTAPETKTYIRVGPHQTDFAVVFAHGLWLNSRQFQEQFANLAFANVNFIAINYGGHGPEAGNSKNISAETWMQDIRRAIEYAHTLGKRVIVVGQSTGAALALRNYFEDESSTDGMILIEPAIRVKAEIHTGVCVVSSLTKQAQSWGRLISQLNSALPEYPVELALGCLVNNIFTPLLAHEIEVRKDQVHSIDFLNSEPAENRGYFDQLDAIASLARRVKIPTLIVSSAIENVVDPLFIESLRNNIEPHLVQNLAHSNRHGSPNTIPLISFSRWIENAFSIQNFANQAATRARSLMGSPSQLWTDQWAPLVNTWGTGKKQYDGLFLILLQKLLKSFALQINLQYAETCSSFREPVNCQESYMQMKNLISVTRSTYLTFYNQLKNDDRLSLNAFLKLSPSQIFSVSTLDPKTRDVIFELATHLGQITRASDLNANESALVSNALEFFNTKSGFYSSFEYLNEEARQFNRQP